MESSALVYVLLTAATVLLGLCVENREYVPGYTGSGRSMGGASGSGRGVDRPSCAGRGMEGASGVGCVRGMGAYTEMIIGSTGIISNSSHRAGTCPMNRDSISS